MLTQNICMQMLKAALFAIVKKKKGVSPDILAKWMVQHSTKKEKPIDTSKLIVWILVNYA